MAGNYPDAPGHRMLIDRDGSIGLVNGSSQLTGAQMIALNRDSGNAGLATPNAVLIFPELRDVVALEVNISAATAITGFSLEASTNTTNGTDGTWTAVSPTGVYNADPNYRNPAQRTLPGIRALRIAMSANFGYNTVLDRWHVYGTITAGQNPNRLAIWHPTLDQLVGPAYFDWGDVPRSSSADRTFRVKNLSPTLTANSVNVSLDALTDTTPSVVAQHLLSVDGITFGATAAVGTLAPGAISGVMTLRRVTPSNAVLSLWALRLLAIASSWT